MTKKVIDIFPPKKFREKHIPLKEVVEGEEKLIPDRPKRRNILKKGLFSFFFSLISVFVIFHFFLARVEIEIWPETETLNFAEKITVDVKTEEPDLISKVIPGKIFEVEKSAIEEFSSTGKFLKKAEGTIRLYNAYSVQSETWREGTRFVSSEGKLFLSKDKINVPGASIKNGKIVPSHIDVPVIAAEGGQDYNIGPSHFSVFVYRGTPRYTKFYGESFEAMKEGGEAFQVTKEDLGGAENILIEKVKSESESALKGKIPEGYLFLKEAMETKILEKKFSDEVGTATEKFNFQIKARGAAISFRGKDIKDFAVSSIFSQLPEGKKFYQESLETEYQTETFNLESEKLGLSLFFSAKIYSGINLDSFKKGLSGKSLNEAKVLLENQPEIVRYQIRFSLPWLKNIPNKLEKIKISLRID